MKKFTLEFLRRGLIACGIGPIVLAVLYLILYQQGSLETVHVSQVITGIYSLTALAFIAGGMNAIYQIEQVPLMAAILIHGVVLYVSYLATYLINGWLQSGLVPILVFTGIFIVGYLVIWAIIYFIVNKRTKQLNEALMRNQQGSGDLNE